MCVHAALEWAGGDNQPGRQPTLRLQVVPDEDALWLLRIKLEDQGYKISSWYEPDLGNELAAIAVEHTNLHLPLLFESRGGETDDND